MIVRAASGRADASSTAQSSAEADSPGVDQRAKKDQSKPAIVKKYANRRLYNTATSSYVTLDELCLLVRGGKEFVVYDAKTGEDITRSVLTQIILEEDAKGRNLLPISFLRQVIGFYDDSLHAFLPRYLELSMENFARNQDKMRGYVEQTFGRFFPVNQFEDMARQNIALMQKATAMFTPFGEEPLQPSSSDSSASRSPEQSPEQPSGKPAQDDTTTSDELLSNEMQLLKQQMDALQRQLRNLDKRALAEPGKKPRGR